ncbi:MAG TPA: PAS domain-containing protein, partial [Desulfatiglandales bacterium]|nr:PAS domain-containing protein [Desulfatiglandales bacterium]
MPEKLTSRESKQRIRELEKKVLKYKHIEQILRQYERNYRVLLEASTDAVFLETLDGQILDCNTKACELFGYTKKELTGLTVADLVPDEVAATLPNIISEEFTTGRIFIETTNKKKNGELFPVEVSTRLVTLDKTQLVVAYVRDISRQKHFEDSLGKEKLFIETILDSIVDAFIIFDQDGKIIRWNKAINDITGYNDDEIPLIKATEWFAEEDRPRVMDAVRTMLKEGYARFEARVLNKYGVEIPYDLVVTLIKDGKGNAIGICGIGRDLTDRKKAEEALRSSEEKYRSLVESTKDSIYLVDKGCRYLFMNQKHLTRFGLLSDKILGRPYGDFHTREETKEFSQKIKKVSDSGSSLSYEYRSKRTAGYFLRTLSPVKDTNGKTTAVTIVSKDITERKRTEDALRESEEFTSGLLINSPHPIIVINKDTSIRYVNPALEKLTGFSSSELIGKKRPYPWWVDVDKISRDLEIAMSKGLNKLDELFKKKNGQLFMVEITSLPIKSKGKFRYLISNWVDITERKHAEESLRESEEKYRKVVENANDAIFIIQDEVIKFP